MKIYLDNSFLNRPFDDQEIGLNRLEAEILFFILEKVKQGEITLVNSSVIEFENSLNPLPQRKRFVEQVLKNCKIYQNIDKGLEKKALHLEKGVGFRPIDALHLAAAEAAQVDFFITCDYNVVSKYKGRLRVVNPVGFLNYYESRN